MVSPEVLPQAAVGRVSRSSVLVCGDAEARGVGGTTRDDRLRSGASAAECHPSGRKVSEGFSKALGEVPVK